MPTQNFSDFVPEAVKIVRDEEIYKMLYDPVYEPIIVVLREGPMTIEEITARYNDYVEIQGRTNNLSAEVIEKNKKSEMTIYRYIKDLGKENINIVTQAGRQIETGKTTTKALYARTATVFYPILKSEKYWDNKESEDFVNIQATLLELYFKDRTVSKELLKELLKRIDTDSSQVGAKVFEENNEIVKELTKGLTFKELDKHLTQLSYLIMLFESESYLEDFRKCCKEK